MPALGLTQVVVPAGQTVLVLTLHEPSTQGLPGVGRGLARAADGRRRARAEGRGALRVVAARSPLRDRPRRGDAGAAEIAEQELVARERGERRCAAVRPGGRRARAAEIEVGQAAQEPPLLASRNVAIKHAHHEGRARLKPVAKGVGEVGARHLLFGRRIGATSLHRSRRPCLPMRRGRRRGCPPTHRCCPAAPAPCSRRRRPCSPPDPAGAAAGAARATAGAPRATAGASRATARSPASCCRPIRRSRRRRPFHRPRRPRRPCPNRPTRWAAPSWCVSEPLEEQPIAATTKKTSQLRIVALAKQTDGRFTFGDSSDVIEAVRAVEQFAQQKRRAGAHASARSHRGKRPRVCHGASGLPR